jgi:signal transduction histidine kinase/ActR/RegA family two-component response regulator
MTAMLARRIDDPELPPSLALVDAIEDLAGARDLPRVMEIVRTTARRVAGADGATFVLRDGDRCHYADEDAISPLWKGQKFPMSACISGWAMLNRRPAIIPDIYVDDRIPHDAYRLTFVKSLIMIPVGAEESIAAIGVYWARSYRPHDRLVKVLESLARATATALVNVSLETSLKDVNQRLSEQTEEARRSNEVAASETERRHQAEELLSHLEKIEAIGNLTSGIAHDFNNVLGVIMGSLDMLLDSTKEEQSRQMARLALSAAEKGAALTKSLLAFARRQPLEPQRVDLNDLVEETAQLLHRTLHKKIEITVQPFADVYPVVVDPAQLQSALLNLATNARDAMPDGGKLHIATLNRHLDAAYASAHREVVPGDYALIEISDTGTGMSPDVAAKIFDPFFTTKPLGKGTGLGLAMVFGFVKQSGGHINVYSEKDLGTTFRLYLPRLLDDVARAATPANDSILPAKGETVLVVEDNPTLRQLLVQQLIGLGYRVIEANDATAALDIIGKQAIDVLIADVIMPGSLNGYDIAAKARELAPKIAIIMMSGFSAAITKTVDARAGSAPLLAKPYGLDELSQMIRDELDKSA